jgi:probable phosphoglycerate mutase
MATFLLIRHASHDLLGRVLAGRMPGVVLNANGHGEAEHLAAALAHCRIDAIFSSPMERAQETARPLAQQLGLEVQLDPAFHEIDFGEWTSLTFAELEPQPEWRRWNAQRDQAQPPCGETIAAVQTRFIAGLERLAESRPDAHIAVFSHGDAIKAALMHYLRVPLNLIARLEVAPASISTLTLSPHWIQIVSVNRTAREYGSA